MTELTTRHADGDAAAPCAPGPASDLRRAGAAELADALEESRAQLLTLFEGFERSLGPDGLAIAIDPVLNLPLWELGHVGWFEEFWLSRHAARAEGVRGDPRAPRAASCLPFADALYDSSAVAHASRWRLELPGAVATRDYLAAVRQRTLALLQTADADDDALYFFRLALFHEAMHREAWHFMAQRLGLDLGGDLGGGATGTAPTSARAGGGWHVPADTHRIGGDEHGFAFDNELGAQLLDLPGYDIDRAPVAWAGMLAFVDAGGYDDERLWTPAGRAWLRRTGARHPSPLRRTGDGWVQGRFGRWIELDPAAPAVHLTAHEAEAWCRWAGRRLPTEAEWEGAARRAARTGEAFDWGEVWEWTASRFEPYPGFVPHPYADYSAPWFDGRPVLRGASFATAPCMKHPAYRNFFGADRHDVFAGFRSCAAPGGGAMAPARGGSPASAV